MHEAQHIGPTSEFKAASITSVEIHGEDCVIVCDIEGRISAFKDQCAHLKLPISNGTIKGKRLICPWHGASFDPYTGEALSLPAVKNLEAVPIKVQMNQIVADG